MIEIPETRPKTENGTSREIIDREIEQIRREDEARITLSLAKRSFEESVDPAQYIKAGGTAQKKQSVASIRSMKESLGELRDLIGQGYGSFSKLSRRKGEKRREMDNIISVFARERVKKASELKREAGSVLLLYDMVDDSYSQYKDDLNPNPDVVRSGSEYCERVVAVNPDGNINRNLLYSYIGPI